MNESVILLIPVFFPILLGTGLLAAEGFSGRKGKKLKRRTLIWLTAAGLALTALSVLLTVCRFSPGDSGHSGMCFTLFQLTSMLPVYFRADELGIMFALVVTVVWMMAGIFGFEYMKHEESNGRYFGFYLIVYGILIGLDFSGNLITFYLFYECMTLLSLPLVLHSRSREAVLAGLKYLFYSLCGAYMVLFGLYFVYRYANTLTFTAGGVLDGSLLAGHEALLLTAAFLMLMGFGVKAGLFPMHGWLPTAHPVAPAPASAALSGIIVKCGVLGVIRVIYYIFGVDFLRGSWVQYVFLTLSLITVSMGSMLAWLEKGLKKRLAYSTVSQVSYILFGLGLMNRDAMTGALMHVVFHALIKSGLFLCAGAIIFRTGKTRVDELDGIGKKMPVTLWCYTLLSLSLIGIPPAGGFVSKWYLAQGALASDTGIFTWAGPVVLLLSALLTAGYLLPITMRGFFPGRSAVVERDDTRTSRLMLIPLLILAVLSVLPGMLPGGLMNWIGWITGQVL